MTATRKYFAPVRTCKQKLQTSTIRTIPAMSASSLKSFAPEICSLICQDPILTRRASDLNFICFISHAFRKEAQRLLFYRFPCLRSTSRIKAWCMSLKRRPHLSKDVQELVLFLPPHVNFHPDDVARLVRALQMCVNLKELTVLSQLRKPEWEGQWTPALILDNLPFTLTKFVNGLFRPKPSIPDISQFSEDVRNTETALEFRKSRRVSLSPFLENVILACRYWY